MSDLIDRLSGESRPDRPKIHIHQFVGGLRLYAVGTMTRGEIATNWDLQGDEATQASDVADLVDAETGASNKIIYVLRFEAIIMLTEDDDDTFYHTAGAVNKTKVLADAGL